MQQSKHGCGGIIGVFAKRPSPGRVKTRLIGVLGSEGAAQVAAALLGDTLDALGSLGQRVIIATDRVDGAWPDAHVNSFPRWDQGRGDLGARLETIFCRGLAQAPWLIALGADTPGLPSAPLLEAIDALSRYDAVLGPSNDGGYWLLGLRRCTPGLLAGLPWSQPQTLVATTARLRSEGLTLHRVAAWYDIDEPDDLRRAELELAAGSLRAPRLAVALRSLGRPT